MDWTGKGCFIALCSCEHHSASHGSVNDAMRALIILAIECLTKILKVLKVIWLGNQRGHCEQCTEKGI